MIAAMEHSANADVAEDIDVRQDANPEDPESKLELDVNIELNALNSFAGEFFHVYLAHREARWECEIFSSVLT